VSVGVTKITHDVQRASGCLECLFLLHQFFLFRSEVQTGFREDVAQLKYLTDRRKSCHCMGHEGIWGEQTCSGTHS